MDYLTPKTFKFRNEPEEVLFHHLVNHAMDKRIVKFAIRTCQPSVKVLEENVSVGRSILFKVIPPEANNLFYVRESSSAGVKFVEVSVEVLTSLIQYMRVRFLGFALMTCRLQIF